MFDYSRAGSIDALDVHRLLTLAGINATQEEAEDMIAMAGDNLTYIPHFSLN